MASAYPGGLDNFSTSHQDNVDEVIHASTINDNADAINKIEAELGTDPKGAAADVKTRIANIEADFPVTESNMSLSDVTTLNVSTSKHGFAPKAPNDATKFLDGTGAYSVPAGGGGDTLHTVSSSTSTLSIDFSTANVWDITLSANCTFSLTGFTNAKPDFLTLILRQDGTGSRTVTWPTITWIGSGIAPTLQTAPSSVDTVVLFSVDGGTTVYGIAQSSQSGLRSGTSFPGSPSDGDLFYRTDRNILYFYKNAVTSWLSVDRKYIAFGEPESLSNVTTSGTLVMGRHPMFEDIYVETFQAVTFVSTTNNGSNFWTVSLLERDSSLTSTTLATFNTSADTHDVATKHAVTVNALVSSSSFSWLDLATAKTGTPNTVRLTAVAVSRSVG